MEEKYISKCCREQVHNIKYDGYLQGKCPKCGKWGEVISMIEEVAEGLKAIDNMREDNNE